MKLAGLALLVLVGAAFPGAARAGDIVIQDTLTGFIVGGGDAIGAFGGGSLADDTFTYSFSADLSLLNSGSYATDHSSYESLTDYSQEGSISESVTINGGTYSMTSTTNPDLAELSVGGDATQSSLAVDIENLISPDYPYLSVDLSSTSAFALGTVTSQAALESLLGNIEFGTQAGIDIFDNNGNADVLVVNFTPEPSTWQLLILACCGLALLLRRRGLTRLSRSATFSS